MEVRNLVVAVEARAVQAGMELLEQAAQPVPAFPRLSVDLV